MRTNELYASAPVQDVLGSTLRPGGLSLTERILELIAPKPKTMVLDAGCGYGATLDFLQQYKVQALGLDLAQDFVCQARQKGHDLLQGNLNDLPLAAHCLDLIICECAWNLTDKNKSLAEFFRTLRPQGLLALTDIFAQSQPEQNWPVHCCFAQATSLAKVQEQVTQAGFKIELVEDHTPFLKKTAAEFVFRYGSLQGFWQAVTGSADQAQMACTAAQNSRPGLFLLIARRT